MKHFTKRNNRYRYIQFYIHLRFKSRQLDKAEIYLITKEQPRFITLSVDGWLPTAFVSSWRWQSQGTWNNTCTFRKKNHDKMIFEKVQAVQHLKFRNAAMRSTQSCRPFCRNKSSHPSVTSSMVGGSSARCERPTPTFPRLFWMPIWSMKQYTFLYGRI